MPITLRGITKKSPAGGFHAPLATDGIDVAEGILIEIRNPDLLHNVVRRLVFTWAVTNP